MIELQSFLEFTFQSFWIFAGMIMLIGSVSTLIKNIFSFIPQRIHFGGTQNITEVELDSDTDKITQ